ncbi:MAG TPA: hypothetical protein VK178_03420 [Opitutaceae bacterium]|nr:hypothetical protein [Opitutaceae bacterium]
MKKKGLVASLLLGVVSSLYLRFGAYLSVGETLCLCAVPLLLFSGAYRDVPRAHRVTIILFCVWFIGAVLSDWYNEVNFDYALRGWGQLSFFFGSYAALLGLAQKRRFRVDWFMVGATLSKLVNIFGLRPGNIDARTEEDFAYASWKLIYGQVLDCGIMALAALIFGKRPKTATLLLVSAGVVNLLMGARSMGGIQITAAITALVIRYWGVIRSDGGVVLSGGQRAVYVIAVVLVAACVYYGYYSAAGSGLLGPAAQDKAIAERGGRFGAISSSRVQLVGGALAIIDSPIIGYGSWALDYGGYGRRAAELVGVEWRGESRNALGLARMPSHSYIVEFWVEHGILAGIFWLWIGYRLLRFSGTVGLAGVREIAFGTLLLCALAWNYWFSPLGDRMIIAAWLLYVNSTVPQRWSLMGADVRSLRLS